MAVILLNAPLENDEYGRREEKSTPVFIPISIHPSDVIYLCLVSLWKQDNLQECYRRDHFFCYYSDCLNLWNIIFIR